MRILSITAQKPHQTGSGTYMTEMIKAFDRLGHRQAVVFGVYRSDAPAFPDGVRAYPVYFTENTGDADEKKASDIPFPIAGMSDTMPYVSTRYCDMTGEMTAEFEKAFISAITRAVEDLDPDLIVCHHLFLLTSLVRKHFPDRRVFGVCHGSDLRQMRNCLGAENSPYEENSYLSGISSEIISGISRLDALFALHGRQREQIYSIYFENGQEKDPGKVTVIGSGYNPAVFNCDGPAVRRSDDGRVRVIYAGKLCKEKGVPELLSALEAASRRYSFELVMAGGAKEKYTLSLLSRDWPFEIDYLGIITQQELAAEYRKSDIFVLPSYYEGMPLVLIEAMACGLRTICNDLPGVSEWIGETIPDNDTVFVRMPEMTGVDTPLQSSIPDYVERLSQALMDAASQVLDGNIKRTCPDTTGAAWDAVAGKILAKITN